MYLHFNVSENDFLRYSIGNTDPQQSVLKTLEYIHATQMYIHPMNINYMCKYISSPLLMYVVSLNPNYK